MIKSSEYPIGLDISDLSLKFVQLNSSRDRVIVQAFSKIDLQKDVIENGEIKNPDEFIKAVRKMIEKPIFGKVTSNEAVICLPEAQTFIKLLKIEDSQDKLKDAIIQELPKYFPIPIEEMYFDFQTINSDGGNKLVLVGASPKNFVDEYIEVLDNAKLSTVATEIESVAISRAILLEESPNCSKIAERKNYIIIDIGASRTSVFVYAKSTILFDISIPISGDEITEKISKSLKLEKNSAELAKITIGLDGKRAKGVIKKSLAEMIEKLIKKLNGVIDFYQDNFGEYGKIDQIFICGGGANIRSLDKIIEKNIKIPTLVANPLIDIYDPKQKLLENFLETYKLNIDSKSVDKKINESISITQNASVNYTTAIGLALRNVFLK